MRDFYVREKGKQISIESQKRSEESRIVNPEQIIIFIKVFFIFCNFYYINQNIRLYARAIRNIGVRNGNYSDVIASERCQRSIHLYLKMQLEHGARDRQDTGEIRRGRLWCNNGGCFNPLRDPTRRRSQLLVSFRCWLPLFKILLYRSKR